MPKRSTPGATPQVNFRLSAETLAELDLIATTNGLTGRADAVRYVARREAREIRRREKIPKNSPASH
jgi:metal-responsive CopG/Arc/MetJ family transcriptional regulator